MARRSIAADPRAAARDASQSPLVPAGGLSAAQRWPVLDLLRGVAIVAMIVYHFCFDLAVYGYLVADFADLRWVVFRTPILGSFLFVAGVSLALAEVRGQSATRYWRRIAMLAAAAALVTVGSYVMFPGSYIYFGVLHGLLVMSLLARPLVRIGGPLIVAGAVVVLMGATLHFAVFDRPALHWIGLMTFKPRTEDYVPLFPWFGLMLIGVGAGSLALRRIPQRMAALRVPAPLSWVAWLGRHSLLVYLVHQPLLIGILLFAKSAG